MPFMAGAEIQKTAALRYVFSGAVFRRSLIIAAVVGCLLSITNQGDVLLREPFGVRIGIKIVLNFLIPFTVASVSALVNRSAG